MLYPIYKLEPKVYLVQHERECCKDVYIIIRVYSAFSLVASYVLLKYTRTDDVN